MELTATEYKAFAKAFHEMNAADLASAIEKWETRVDAAGGTGGASFEKSKRTWDCWE